MPDRIIRERACHSPTLDMLSDGAERLFWRLTSQADDQGRFDADARTLLASCFPLRIGRLPPGRVEQWRDELVRADLICLYRQPDKQRVFGAFCTWDRWQRKRESKPRRPGPSDEGVEILDTAANCGELPRVAANCGELPPTRARASGVSRESLTTESREPRDGRRGSRGEPPRTAATSPRDPDAHRVLDYLNRKAGKQYQPTPTNLGFIRARLDDGATVEQCQLVIVQRTRKWRDDPKMREFLRPATLFNREKFSQYLGELPAEAFMPEEDPADA